MWRKLKVRFAALIGIAVGANILAAILAKEVPALKSAEFLAYDRHAASEPRLKPDPRIVIVGMDDDSLGKMGRASYPLPRIMHARLIHALKEAGAKVIAFDVWFTAETPDDVELARAARECGPVFCALDSDSQNGQEGEALHFIKPARELRRALKPFFIRMRRGPGDKVRDFLPYPVDSETGERPLHMAVALAAAWNGDLGKEPLLRDRFTLGRISAPVGMDQETLVRYAGPAGTWSYVPYHEAYSGNWKRRSPTLFRDKIVLVGRIDDVEDRHLTPLGDMNGVEIIANAAQTLLQSLYISHIHQTANWIAGLILSLVFVLNVARFGWPVGILVLGGESLSWWWLTQGLFVRESLWIDAVGPIFAVGLTCAGTGAYEAMRMLQVFRRLLPSDVAGKYALAGAGESAHTAEEEMSVVFCDVRNYTSLSESLDSAALEKLIHAFFRAGEEIAHRTLGQVDKFVGDSIMLYFQAIRGREPHEMRAVRWALEMQESARRIEESGAAGAIGFQVGVGIASGKVRIGSVGARRRIQHTLIGDAVNTASRLQDLTKQRDTPILIGERTYARIRDQIEAEPFGEVTVKGKQDPLRVYGPIRILERSTAAARKGDE